MVLKKEIDVLKKYAPKCKHCDNDCHIQWDNRGKIDFDHCNECHFKYVGKGHYISEVIG
jgi:hypothetical protein